MMTEVKGKAQSILCGYIDIKNPNKSRGVKLKSWKRQWVVLRPMTDHSVGRSVVSVDIYPDELTATKKASNKATLLLDDVRSIRRVRSRSRPYAFSVNSTTPLLYLSTGNESESQRWIWFLRHVFWPPQLIHEPKAEFHEISVIENSYAQRLALTGNFWFHLKTDVITLYHIHHNSKMFEWKLPDLKRFFLALPEIECDVNRVLVIQVGSRSSSGPGDLLIFSENAKQILECIMTCIKDLVSKQRNEHQVDSNTNTLSRGLNQIVKNSGANLYRQRSVLSSTSIETRSTSSISTLPNTDDGKMDRVVKPKGPQRYLSESHTSTREDAECAVDRSKLMTRSMSVDESGRRVRDSDMSSEIRRTDSYSGIWSEKCEDSQKKHGGSVSDAFSLLPEDSMYFLNNWITNNLGRPSNKIERQSTLSSESSVFADMTDTPAPSDDDFNRCRSFSETNSKLYINSEDPEADKTVKKSVHRDNCEEIRQQDSEKRVRKVSRPINVPLVSSHNDIQFGTEEVRNRLSQSERSRKVSHESENIYFEIDQHTGELKDCDETMPKWRSTSNITKEQADYGNLKYCRKNLKLFLGIPDSPPAVPEKPLTLQKGKSKKSSSLKGSFSKSSPKRNKKTPSKEIASPNDKSKSFIARVSEWPLQSPVVSEDSNTIYDRNDEYAYSELSPTDNIKAVDEIINLSKKKKVPTATLR